MNNISVQESLEMLKAILGSIDEGIHAVNAEGITVYYNEVAARLDGLDASEVIGKHVLDVFPSLQKETSTLLKVVQTGEPIYHIKQNYTTVRGHRVDTVNTTLPIRVDGKLVGALEVAKDLTGIREMTERLIDLQARMVAIPHDSHTGKKSPHASLPVAARYTFDDIITRDPMMLSIKELSARAATTSSSVLVSGETGTGKELFVHAIHAASPRRKKPLIAQNCAALPASLLEGLLFGTVKGSFTGAENRPGLFELADGGTLFLDEIHAMPLDLQAKMLRVLQDGWVRRVGDVKEKAVDFRLITAMNIDPLEAVERGLIRADLLYRIQTVTLAIPRLRERPNDIVLLTQHFLDTYNHRLQRKVSRVTAAVEKRFIQYAWPGNVRELEHVIEGAMNMATGSVLREEHLPWQMQRAGTSRTRQVRGLELLSGALPDAVAALERQMIEAALEQHGGNIQAAARQLQIPRQTLQSKLKKLR